MSDNFDIDTEEEFQKAEEYIKISHGNKTFVFDIDGVLTDGTVTVDIQGREQKKINLKDIDAIFELEKEGFLLAAITGEDTEIVSYFENRFPICTAIR